MSGVGALFHRDNTPADRAVVSAMAAAMQRRGPDAQAAWQQGPVGLAHAALHTTPESQPQPFTLDGAVWITADVRLDNRRDLQRQLEQHGHHLRPDAADAELVLRAYATWQDAGPTRLLGDFAFIIWDARQPKLLCARDHFGARSLHYYVAPGLFAAATDIAALGGVPGVPRIIDPARIGDYILEELEGIDKTSTFFQHIQRLPPAHTLVVTPDQVRLQAYWQLEPPAPLRLRSDGDYAEAFREVLTQAVADRLRAADPAQVGSMLSGGLDSSSVVALARQIHPQPLKTFSLIADDDVDDAESRLRQAVVDQGGLQAIGIQPHQLADYRADLDSLLGRADNLFLHKMTIPQVMSISAQRHGVKILLNGAFGDDALTLPDGPVGDLLRRGRWLRAVQENHAECAFWGETRRACLRQLLSTSRRTFTPAAVRQVWRGLRGTRALDRYLANSALHPDYIQQYATRARLQRLYASLDTTHLPQAADRYTHWFNHAYIPAALERYDGIAAFYGVEARQPFMDKRLIEFCAALPWDQFTRHGWIKYILRQGHAGSPAPGGRLAAR
jgi:asparagine synthase (glutamine-hydrolysing)